MTVSVLENNKSMKRRETAVRVGVRLKFWEGTFKDERH